MLAGAPRSPGNRAGSLRLVGRGAPNTTVADAAARLVFDPANSFVVGAFVDGQLIGTAAFYRERGLKERHKGRIWGVYVTLGMRGKGIGRRNLKVLLERAAAIEGIEQILLSVNPAQPAATKLYESLGFRSFGHERRALRVGDRYVDEEHMVLYVDSSAM